MKEETKFAANPKIDKQRIKVLDLQWEWTFVCMQKANGKIIFLFLFPRCRLQQQSADHCSIHFVFLFFHNFNILFVQDIFSIFFLRRILLCCWDCSRFSYWCYIVQTYVHIRCTSLQKSIYIDNNIILTEGKKPNFFPVLFEKPGADEIEMINITFGGYQSKIYITKVEKKEFCWS